MAEYARTRGELSELKARLNELKEQIRAMNEQRNDDEAGRPEKPPSRRLTDPSTYLRAALRCGDLRDYSDIIQACNAQLFDRGLEDPSRALLPPPEWG